MNKGTLYFLPAEGDEIVVAEGIFSNETEKFMRDYLENNGYKSPPYWRFWGTGAWYQYDFGSYVEFFRWEDNKYYGND